MSTKLNRNQAIALLDEALKARIGAPWKEWRADGAKRLASAARDVERHVTEIYQVGANGENADRMPLLVQSIRAAGQQAARWVPVLKAALRAVEDLARDPGRFAPCMAYAADFGREVGDALEQARVAAQSAKDGIEFGEHRLATNRFHADSADEAWSAALLEFERVVDAANQQSRAWHAWYVEAIAASQGRDSATLERLRKAPPAGDALDTVAGWPRDRPFAEFDREFQVQHLPRNLQETIRKDRAKAMSAYAKVQMLPVARGMLERQVRELRIEPADGRKALVTLGLPKSALPKLQAAIDEPPARREKAVEAVARANKVAGNGRALVEKLKKAGVF